MRSVVEMGASVPAFLAKLWKLVDDPDTDNLISWSPGGKMFTIQNQADFARELLPLYYKHNNMASFIRQLNMYGFHKFTSVDNGGLKAEKDEIEFYHPCFLQGHPYLLEHIKRKIAHPKSQIQSISDEKTSLKPELMNKVLVDVKQIKGKQESLDARFSVMKHENEALWREVALLRQKHIKQQQIVNNLIQFLMSLVQPSRGGPLKTGGLKRRHQLMINNAAHNNCIELGKKLRTSNMEFNCDMDLNELHEDDENGPIIHEVAEHDRISEPDSVRNILLCSDPDARSSVSPIPSPTPSFSAESVGQEVLIGPDENSEYPPQFDMMNEEEADIEMPDKVIEEILNDKEDIAAGSNKSQAASNNVPSPVSIPVATIPRSKMMTTLPPDIFEGDETSSQDGSSVSLNEVNRQAALSASEDPKQIYLDSTDISNIDFVNTVTSGAYNPNLNLNSTAVTSPTKGKKKIDAKKSNEEPLVRNIKEEILNPDEESLSNMVLVESDSRPSFQRFQSMRKQDLLPSRTANIKIHPNIKEEVDDHLESMQSDLESIKQLLKGENYSLDANALLSLFGGEDQLYNLPPMNPSDMTLEKPKETTQDSCGQLLPAYTPPLFDFDDIELDAGDGLRSTLTSVIPPLDSESSSTLNTPQMSFTAPDFSSKK